MRACRCGRTSGPAHLPPVAMGPPVDILLGCSTYHRRRRDAGGSSSTQGSRKRRWRRQVRLLQSCRRAVSSEKMQHVSLSPMLLREKIDMQFACISACLATHQMQSWPTANLFTTCGNSERRSERHMPPIPSQTILIFWAKIKHTFRQMVLDLLA